MSATNFGVVLEKRNRHMWKRMDGWRRIGVAGVIGAIALVALGDRGKAQIVPGGIDPLEILNLQVRANAIIVLDSSGSMGEDSLIDPALPNQLSGDTRFSKMYQAKQVLSQVIAANERKVSFQFGRYTQPFAAMTLDGTPAAGSTPGAPGRFHYTTTSTLSPGMTVNTIVDLRSYVVPAAAFINLQEPNGGATVAVPIAAGRYATGMQLATEIQNKLALDLRANTYTVTYLNSGGGPPAVHRFQIARSGGARPSTFAGRRAPPLCGPSSGSPTRTTPAPSPTRAITTRAGVWWPGRRATSTSCVRTRATTTPSSPRRRCSTSGPTRAGTSTAR